MAKLGDMLVSVGADFSGFDRAMGTMSQRLGAIDRDARKAFSGFDAIGSRMQSFGTVATAAITLPLAAGGFAVTKMAADFDQGMRKVSSLIDNVTEKDFKNLSVQVLQLSRDLGVDAVNATGALYQALSTGIPKENAVDFLRISSIAAIAGMTDTKVAVDGITTVLQAYNLDAKETRAVSDAMFAAVKIGKLEFPELAASIGTAAGTAKLLGISYQELLAAGATLTNTTGQKIPEAMTMLASVMKALIDPSKELKVLLKDFSKEGAVATVQTLGFEATLQKLWVASGKNVEVFEKAFGRIEGFRAGVGLTGDNAEKTAQQLEYLSHASDGVGQAQLAANEINKSTTRQWEKTMASIKATAIEMGTALLPAVNSLLQASLPLIEMLRSAVDWFTKLSPGIQTTILAFTAAAAAVGPLALAFGLLLSAVSTVGKTFLSMGGVLASFGGQIATTSTAVLGFATTAIPAALGALSTFTFTTIPAAILGASTLARVMLVDASAAFISFARTAVPAATSALITFATTTITAATASLATLSTTALPAVISGLALVRTGIAATGVVLASFAAEAVTLAITGITTLATVALPLLGVAALAAAVGFAGWKLGQWAYDNIPAVQKLGDVLADFFAMTTGWLNYVSGVKGAASVTASSLADIGASVAKLEEIGNKLGVSFQSLKQQYASGAISLEAYNQKLNELVRSKVGADMATGNLEEAFKKLGITSQSVLTKNIVEARAAVDVIEKAFRRGAASAEDLTKAKAALATAIRAVTTSGKPNVDMLELLTKKNKALQEAVNGAKLAYDDIARSFVAGKASAEQLEAAHIKLKKAQDNLDPLEMMERNEKAWKDSFKKIEQDIEDMIASYEKLDKASEELAKSTTDLAVTFWKAHEEMREEGQKEIKITATLDARLPEQITEAIAQNKVFKEDLKTLGIEHVRHADAAVEAYERISNSGKATATELLRAEKAMLEAVISERRANGEAVLKEDMKRLEEIEKRLNIHKGVWVDFAKQVSTIMTDLGKNITENIFGLFRGNKENEKLDQEAAALRKSLVERAQDWEDYKLSVEEKMVSLREKNAAGLAEQVADLAAALAEKRSDYEDYVADVGQKLEDLRNKHGEAESQEVQELASKLRDRESEYEDYVRTVEEKIQDIRSSHASALEGELEDLRENLRERAEDYADYVSDVGTKLGRLRADSADALGDRGTDTSRRIADKKKEFKRDEEDINTKIQRLLRSGKKANDVEIQDLQKALQRKRQDLDEYVKEQQEDLADFTAEHKRKLAEQESDLKLSLDRKTRDEKQARTEIEERISGAVLKHRMAEDEQLKDLRASLAAKATDLAAFQLATQEKIAAVTIKHAEAVAKEEAELLASLAKRTAEWQKYQDGVALKIDDLNAKAAAQLGAEEAALKAGLDEKLAAWEAYKSEVAGKLVELADKHQTFADQIKTALQGSLDAMGQAITRFGVEFLEGKLFKWLGDLVTTILPSVGTALAGVFGGIGGAAAGGIWGAAGDAASAAGDIGNAAGQAASTAGSAAGAAGQAAGMGMAAMTGMATGVVSAVSGVIGNFQFMAMNKSLDLIEKSTRFSEIHLFHSLGKLNDFLPKLKDIWDYLWLTQIPALNNLAGIMEDNLAQKLVDIKTAIAPVSMTPAMAGGSAAPSFVIQNNTFRDRDDIDYIMNEIGKRTRETGNTI